MSTENRSASKLSIVFPVAIWALLLFTVFQPPAPAQEASDAIVVGSVLDTSRAAIAGASVKLTHVATNAVTEVHTDERGQYRTPPLRIGEYSIAIESGGFKRFIQTGVVLSIGDVRQVDAVLEVGQVSDSVNVVTTAPLLQTADATVGTVIGNQQIEELPLNGRDYLQLAALSPGTVPSTTAGIGISIGGQGGFAAAYLLDGIDNNNTSILYSYGNQKEAIKPSVDAIEEFKVVTNTYAAEYGHSSAGVVSVSIKSGTNQIHGTAYEFLRNQILDAKNFFATSKPPYKRNDYGASIGGPIIRNKIFAFGDFELINIRQSTTVVDTVPTLAERQGLFPTTIYDPTTYNPATGQRTPFAGNQIPANLMDPVALKVLSWYPLPQTSALTNNYVYNSPANQDPRRWDFRIDDIISDKQNAFFRYSSQTQDSAPTSNLPPNAEVGYYTGGSSSVINSHGFGVGYNIIWSPTLISSIHAGWNYLLSVASSVDKENLNQLIGLQGVDENYAGGLASMPITGFTTLGGGGLGNIDGSQTRQLSGDLTWTKGSHTIKFGAQALWLQTNFFSAQQADGILNFNGQYTRNSSTLTGGSALADFLLGDSSSGSLSNFEWVGLRMPMSSYYVQDDWRVNQHLTLNIGLRYELTLPPVDTRNAMSNFDIDSDPAHPQLILASSNGGRSAEALQQADYLQLAPRFGLAYSLPDNKTVIRAGYGLFYANVNENGGMASLEINPPYHLQVSLTTDPTKPSLFLRTGFPAGSLSLANEGTLNLVSIEPGGAWPYSQVFNFNIQRQLPGQILLEVGFYANYLDHSWRLFDANPALPGPGNINSRRLYQSVAVPGTPYSISPAEVYHIQKDAYSRYNALQAKLEKRYSKGLTFIASYSWSKTMALGDTNMPTIPTLQNILDWDADRAVALQDMTQHFVGSAVYELPFGKGKTFGSQWNRFTDAVLGGWSVGPIVTVDTGMPLNLTVNGNPSNSGNDGADRPNVVGNWHLSDPTVQEWFNTAAFVPNAKYTYGDAGRDVLRGPGLINLDIAAHKTFRVTERISAQLRLESFNATNTPALGAPNTVVGSPLFGEISSAGTPRDNQIGLKILF